MKGNIASRAIKTLREEGMRSFPRRASVYMAKRLWFFALRYSLPRIKGLSRDCTVNELLDFAFADCAGLIIPAQVRSEVSGLLEMINRMKPNVILEIGTANGGTLFLFSRVASEDATIISIDLPLGLFGGGYPAWRTSLYQSFALPGQRIHLIRADSHRMDTLEQVSAILDGREVDFLFIDGDHAYEGAKTDFEMYGPLVRKGGIIAFHDIVPGEEEIVGLVPKFWSEVRDNHDTREIVENRGQNGYGIGVVQV